MPYGSIEGVKRPKPKKVPVLRMDPLYGWPLTGPKALLPHDSAVSEDLKQELLDWSRFWHEHAGHGGCFRSEAAEAAYDQRGRGLQQRLQRELDRPVAFRTY